MSVRDHVAIYFRKNSRRRALVIFTLAGVLCGGACSNAHKAELIEDYSGELFLNGDISPVVTRTLQRGDFLIEAREDGIELHLTVDAPGKSTELEDRLSRHGVIYQVVSMAAPGDLKITVRSD